MRRIATRAIIEKDGKLLLVKLNLYKAKEQKEFYCTVGGGLDDGEAIREGLKREVIEETGITPEIGNLLYIQQYSDKSEAIEFFFHVTNADDFENIDLSKTTHGQKEIKEIGFYDPRDITVLPEFIKTIDLSTIAKQTKPIFFNYL